MTPRVLIFDIERVPMRTKPLEAWDMRSLQYRRLTPNGHASLNAFTRAPSAPHLHRCGINNRESKHPVLLPKSQNRKSALSPNSRFLA